MNILGISCYYHDSAAVLLQDGMVVAAAEEERFSRVKHDSRFPHLAIAFCLRQGSISAGEIDYAVFYEKPLVKLERIVTTSFALYPRSWKFFREATIFWLKERLWIKDTIGRECGLSAEKILFVDHHTSHAASAFFCSPFKESAVLTVDGVGEWATATLGTATADWGGPGKNSLRLTHEMRFPHSLGLLYSAFTAFLGFEVNEGEYKVMGMAPYGAPRYLEEIGRIARVSADGSITLDLDFFAFHYSIDHSFSQKFISLFGEPRTPGTDFDPADPVCRKYADIAASIQRFTEDVLLSMANYLYATTGLRQLCMAGGVALNSVVNGRILRETPFKKIFIQPAAGDSGGALGAALYVWHVVLGHPRTYVMEHSYLGEGFSDSAIADFLSANSIHHETFPRDEDLIDLASRELQKGKVIGWFQGRFEFGPRALGNRSILADPRDAAMKDKINSKIKFREPFRPFAPAILDEKAQDFFPDLPSADQCYPARFMLLVLPWNKEVSCGIPAVDHLGTARLQTVRSDWNFRYHALLENFARSTGVPVLLNTSFNLRGEPIVASPQDAMRTFHNSGLDLLVLGNHLVRR